MSKTVSCALATAILIAGSAAAQACQRACAPAPVVYQEPVVEYVAPPLPPHFVIEHGPLYDGLGVYAKPRVYAPRVATYAHRYIYGYGVGFSGGPVALAGYPYVKRARYHRHAPPLRVFN